MLEYKEYIYSVYRNRSFSRAAEELHVSQPWLSAAIKKTEQELQLKLFDRTTNPVSLTEAGRFYIEQIEEIMAIEERMQQRFARMRAVSGETLRIGSSMFFCTYVLPSLLRDFRSQNPQAAITLVEGNPDDLVQKLLKGELDVILDAEEVKDKRITTVPWSGDEVVLAVPARFSINRELAAHAYTFDGFLKRNTPGGRKKPAALSAFRDQPFLLLSRENDMYQRSFLLCENAGFTPDVRFLVTQLMTAYYLAIEGQGVTFLRSSIPEYVTPTDALMFYEIDDPAAFRSIYLSYLESGCSGLQSELIDYMGHLTSEVI